METYAMNEEAFFFKCQFSSSWSKDSMQSKPKLP